MRIFTKSLLALALTIVCVGGAKAVQPQDGIGSKIYEKDWTTGGAFPTGWQEQKCTANTANSCLEVVRTEAGNSWDSQIMVGNDIPTVVGKKYVLKLKIKGSETGNIPVQFGTWGDGNAAQLGDLSVTTDYQTFEIMCNGALANGSWIILWVGAYAGKLSIEKSEVYNWDEEDRMAGPQIHVYDFSGRETTGLYHDAGWGPAPSVVEGVFTLENTTVKGDDSNVQYFVSDGILTTSGKEYIVRTTMKGSKNGSLKCVFGTWGQNVNATLNFTNEYQDIDISFSGAPTSTVDNYTHVLFQSGKFDGIVYVKKVGVYEVIAARTITVGANGFATFSTDKAINVDGIVAAYGAKYDGSKIVLTPVTEIPANTGVIIETTEGSYKVPVIESAAPIASVNDLLVSNGSVTADGHHYALGKKNDVVGFVKVKSGVTIPAGKAYLVIPTPTTGARDFIGFDDDVTGVNEVKVQKEVRGEYYNLNGQRVAQPTKGLYIVNGKKVIVK